MNILNYKIQLPTLSEVPSDYLLIPTDDQVAILERMKQGLSDKIDHCVSFDSDYFWIFYFYSSDDAMAFKLRWL